MCERTYDIIDWKSCESYSLSDSSAENNNKILFNRRGTGTRSKDDIASTIVFPKLFHERESETSIVTMSDEEVNEHSPLHVYSNFGAHDMEEQSVYQKVANWVVTQRKYFRHVEPPIDDDELEVIDPVDLFHESILNDYLLITEDDSERRMLLRDFHAHRYHIESIDEALKTNEYLFLRKPSKNVEMELVKIIDFHKLYNPINPKHLRKRRVSSSSDGYPCSLSTHSSSPEKAEEHLYFLGVPRLLENYTILNREGYVIKENGETDIWLAPMEEGCIEKDKQEGNEIDLDFLSSWFSDVYQTDILTDEVQTLITVNTDLMEKATVISVSNASDEDVWVDAPDIPHWFDDEQEELELFNQPSRPLYYYRDRIKGCYRIIGVEDETVVLFSGNDDDTIFYPGDDVNGSSNQSTHDPDTRPSSRLGRIFRSDSDRKTDSGIEDVDDMVEEDVAIASISISNDLITKMKHVPSLKKLRKNVTFEVKQLTTKSSNIVLIGLGVIAVLFAVVLVVIDEKELLNAANKKLLYYISKSISKTDK